MSDEYSMSDLIRNFLRRNEKDQLYHERRAVELWKSEMGSFIADNTKNVEMHKGVLYVKMINASLKFELMGRRSEMIRKLNDKMGVEVVKDILFT